MKRPMVLCATICILLSLCVLRSNTTLVMIFASLSFVLFVTLCFFKATRKYVIILAVVFLFLLNTARIKINYVDKLKTLKSDDFTVRLVVTEVERELDYSALNVKVLDSDGALPDDTKLKLIHYYEGVSVGNELVAEIRLSGIDDSVYKKSYYSSNVYASGYVKQIISKEYGNNIYHTLENFKSKVKGILFSNLSYKNASFCVALTVGDSSYIASDLYGDVKSSGVSHVIVVSGLHMAVICGSIHKLLNKGKFNRQLSSVMTILFMVFFMALCGFSASVLRAGLMYGIFLFSRIFLKKRDGLNSLSIAVVLMLIFNPFLIWDVGFLLSASATFGIIVILPKFEEYIDKYVANVILNLFLKASAVTVSALITTLPISAYYFGAVSTVSIITNILISFAVTVVLILTVVSLLVALVTGNNFIVSVLFGGVEIIASYIILVIRLLGNLPFALVRCDFWVIAAIYILVIAIFVILKYTYNIRKKERSV